MHPFALPLPPEEDGGWRATESDVEELIHYPEDGPLDVPFSTTRTVITQTVTNYLPNSSFLYAAPEVISSDRMVMQFESTCTGVALMGVAG